MKQKIIFGILIFILLINLVVLVIALTNNNPSNPFKEYRFLIGIAFITIGGFVRKSYKMTFENK
ncbi:MAG TPA: hypothetical protein ENG87_05080 [Candidatus Pacearchaeota archaeon]|nr:hypothetical protein [Candidatus Pacearchaeota archaeon]